MVYRQCGINVFTTEVNACILKIEDAVVSGYKKIEKGVVEGYAKIEDKFVDQYLTRDGETVEEAKKRLRR